MQTTWLCSVVLCILFALTKTERATFYNYQVHRVVPVNQQQLEGLKNLEENPNGLSFWAGPTTIGHAVDIMIPPHMLPQFEDMMGSLNLNYEVYISDVQKLIDGERPLVKPKAKFGWTDYYTLDEIYAWLDSLVQAYPGVVTSVVGGQTYQGRQIKGVKVSFKSGNPGVIIEGGIHAREWISPATVTYILNKLLTSKDSVIQSLAQSFDFYVFPSTNPDGYVYTHTTNRMWRKTRSPAGLCYGADPNRNWDFHWMVVGASSSGCSETYGGKSAFSEIETRTLANYITTIAGNLKVYLAFHSYSQLLMIPYGHSQERVSNYNELMTIGREAIAALAKNNGTQYKVGNIYDIIYPASGGSMDWVRGKYNTPYTYTYELRDTGRHGFVLPANQIIDTAEETLNSVVVILQNAKKNL